MSLLWSIPGANIRACQGVMCGTVQRFTKTACYTDFFSSLPYAKYSWSPLFCAHALQILPFWSFSFGQQLPCSFLCLPTLQGLAAAWEGQVGGGVGRWLRGILQRPSGVDFGSLGGEGEPSSKFTRCQCGRTSSIGWFLMTNWAGPCHRGQDHLPSKKFPQGAGRFIRKTVHIPCCRVWSLSYSKASQSSILQRIRFAFWTHLHYQCGE